MDRFKKRAFRLFGFIYVVALFALIVSVVRSAVGYQFDNDELYHSQQVFLIGQGLKPYTDFYSVYAPFLHWLLLPLFKMFGYSFETITYARLVMIGLFFLRMIFATILVNKIFGRMVALLFILLSFLDPFSVFASMQIRPENLAMVVYQILLLVLWLAFTQKSKKSFFLAGVTAGIAILMSLKILPSFLITIVFVAVYSVKNHQFSRLFYFIDGLVLACLVFFGYFFMIGGLSDMFQQLFLDPFLLNNSIKYPTTLNYFYFSNPVIYGHEGKPAAWFYAVLLPVVAFAGGYKVFSGAFSDIKETYRSTKMWLFYMFVIQWVSMMFVHSVWIQYYIPLLWFYSLFAAILVVDILNLASFSKRGQILTAGIITFLFLILIKSSITGNINRSKFNSDGIKGHIMAFWQKIPEDKEVFHNILFRKPVYPIPYGGTFSPYIIDRYPAIESILESRKVPYVIIEGDYFENLKPDTQNYIKTHYEPDTDLPSLHRRK